MNCEKCGAPIEAGHSSCKYCGDGASPGGPAQPAQPLAPTATQQPAAPQATAPTYNYDTRTSEPLVPTAPQRRSPGAIGLLIVALLVGAGVLLSLTGSSRHNSAAHHHHLH